MMKRTILTHCLLICGLLSLVHCGGNDSESSAPFPQNPNEDRGVVNPAKIYVIPTGLSYSAYVNQQSMPIGTACEITDLATPHNIECIMDAAEGDLIFYGAAFELNIPPETCAYTVFKNYWFYAISTGYGPSDVKFYYTHTVDADGNKTTALSDCTADHNSTTTKCSASLGTPVHPEIAEMISDGSTVRCIYDHSKGGGPNCCLGEGQIEVHERTGTGPYTLTDSKTITYGTTVAGCLSGPAARDQEWPTTFSGSGYPVAQVYDTYSRGLNLRYTIDGLPNKGIGTSVFIANHYNEFEHTHAGYYTTGSANEVSVPYAVDPVDDLTGDAMIPGQPSYEFLCLDSAREVIHRINFHIREWNTYRELIKFDTGSMGNPDTDGRETSGGCDYNLVDGPCNDMSDWFDYTSKSSPPYSISTSQPALRATFFPNSLTGPNVGSN